MDFLIQVATLIYKNLIVIWRSKLWFIGEMFLTFLMLPLIAFIVSQVNNDVINFLSYKAVNITGSVKDLKYFVNNIPTINRRWCLTNQTLAYTSNDTLADKVMQKVKDRYKIYLIVKKFENSTLMFETLRQDLNSSAKLMCGKYLGGVHFQTINRLPPQLSYKFLFPQRVGKNWYLDVFWPENNPYSASFDINSIPSSPEYWSSGFLSLQFAIESSFVEMLNKSLNFDVYLQRMPTPKYRSNGVVAFLKTTPVLWSLLVLLTMLHTTKNIVNEKEVGIKTYMMVMGLNPMAFYASHFAIGAIKISLVIFVCAGILSFGFYNISSSMFLAFSLLYAMVSLVFAVFISVIIRRPSFSLSFVVVGWVAFLIIDLFMKPVFTERNFCIFASLNFFTAFKLGVMAASTFETKLMDLGWLNMFSGSLHFFSFGLAFSMLIFDFILLCFLIYYCDAVMPTDDSSPKHPLFLFKCFKPGDHNLSVIKDSSDSNYQLNENIQTENGLNQDEADVNIYKMSKIWSTGQMAVDNLTFSVFRGQITVLLGHNGAGKSTTFSIISGATSLSAGNVLICGENLNENVRICQKQIGYCPQYNPLIPKLTVREHLKIYAKLKSTSFKLQNSVMSLDQTIEKLAEEVQLKAKLDVQAQYLSGGMKRKLCVAMALIGDSRVILLDEPTAGMDPEARHEICELLKRAKKDRTILLTTHYMDEADFLGDRIGIMVKGRLVCSGSPEFLKNKFGTGYILSIVISTDYLKTDQPAHIFYQISNKSETNLEKTAFDNAINGVMQMVRKHAPEARVEKSQLPEFSIIVPVKYKKFFADMFDELENRKTELAVDSFGLSFNTLEQVFLKVGELADDSGEDETDSSKVVKFASEIFKPDKKHVDLMGLWISQFSALLKKHFLSTKRNAARTLLPFALSLILFCSLKIIIQIGSNNNVVREFNLASMQAFSLPVQLPHLGPPPLVDFPFIVGLISSAHFISVPAALELQNFLVKHAYDLPPLGIGAAVYRNESLTGRESVYLLFNGIAQHMLPLTLLLLSNAVLKDKPNSIKMSLEVYDIDDNGSITQTALPAEFKMIIAIIVILAFSSLTSMFVMPLVEDNTSRFKHQMLLTKLNVVMYWISVFVWYFCIYVVFCTMMCLMFELFGWMQNCALPNIVIWSLYFWCCVPFVCCFSFIFNFPIRAFTTLICWNVVMSIFALVIVFYLQTYVSKFMNDFIQILFLILLPSYVLGKGMFNIIYATEMKKSVSVWDVLETYEVVWTLISGIIFWTAMFFMQSRKIALIWHQFLSRFNNTSYQMLRNDMVVDDEDVERERIAMLNMKDSKITLCVRQLYKYYGKFCAVKNLTFGVNQTDCFGLLGINGAGKTSTFDVLTGLSFSSFGSVVVSGVNIVDKPVIGYCPQFDALPADLTGREVLLLLAKLNGFSDCKDRVENVLWSIHMTEEANKLVQYYSGGQKRRLSIGVTLISRATLIMLDEPTAGIDPKTRRYIWQLLLAVRQQNVAILLTSHSMDECEALCNRIGFMNKGSLISIGTTQHFKSRYGNSFMLTFTIANPNPSTFSFMNNLVVKEFRANSTQDSSFMSTLHWEILKNNARKVTWSELFRKAQRIAESFTETAHLPPGSETPLIKDFSITQNSLEQVFLRLTKLNSDDGNFFESSGDCKTLSLPPF